jgi:hypothetical protein
MEQTLDISKGVTKDQIDEMVDHLIYSNYKWNRDRNPQIPPERYECIYGDMVKAMEERYQKEK